MNIDWSKAPEDATHYNPGNKMFYCFSRGNYYFYALNNVDLVFGGSPEDYRDSILIGRPKKQEAWNGEGLPPIGIDCEVHDCQHEYTKQFNGRTVRIVAHHLNLRGNSVAVFEADDCVYHGLVSEKFRPIKTAEQLAEEEKIATIAEMRAVVIAASDRKRATIAECIATVALYEAGYRKQ